MNYLNILANKAIFFEIVSIALIYCVMMFFYFFENRKKIHLFFLLQTHLLFLVPAFMLLSKNAVFHSVACLFGVFIYALGALVYKENMNVFVSRLIFYATLGQALFSFGVFFLHSQSGLELYQWSSTLPVLAEKGNSLGIYLIFIGAGLFLFIFPMVPFFVNIEKQENKKSLEFYFSTVIVSLILFVFSHRFFSNMFHQDFFQPSIYLLNIGTLVSFLFLLFLLESGYFFHYLTLFIAQVLTLFTFFDLSWAHYGTLVCIFIYLIFLGNMFVTKEFNRQPSARNIFYLSNVFFIALVGAGLFFFDPSYFFIKHLNDVFEKGRESLFFVFTYFIFVSALFLALYKFIKEFPFQSKMAYFFSSALLFFANSIFWRSDFLYGELKIDFPLNLISVFFEQNSYTASLMHLTPVVLACLIQVGILISVLLVYFLFYLRFDQVSFLPKKRFIRWFESLEKAGSIFFIFLPKRSAHFFMYIEKTVFTSIGFMISKVKVGLKNKLAYGIGYLESQVYVFVNRQTYSMVVQVSGLLSKIQNGNAQWYLFFVLIVFIFIMFKLLYMGDSL